MKTAVIGLGNMGTALAHLLADNGHWVRGWDAFPATVEEVQKNHRNERYLPGVTLPGLVTADSSLAAVLAEAELVLLAMPSPFLRETLGKMKDHLPPRAVVVGASKGLDPATGKRQSEIYFDLTARARESYVVLSGPSMANEFARRNPCAVTLACESPQALELAAQALQNDYFRVELEADLLGVEWGGVLKNIYAIGLGILDGLHPLASNAKAIFTTLALREMKALAAGWGAEAKTLEGLSGLGDLITTGFSPDSHNRRLGEWMGQGLSLAQAVERIGGLEPEGVQAARRVMVLASADKAPLADAIHRFLFDPVGRAKFQSDIWKVATSGA